MISLIFWWIFSDDTNNKIHVRIDQHIFETEMFEGYSTFMYDNIYICMIMSCKKTNYSSPKCKNLRHSV